jgi:hypothetical protein
MWIKRTSSQNLNGPCGRERQQTLGEPCLAARPCPAHGNTLQQRDTCFRLGGSDASSLICGRCCEGAHTFRIPQTLAGYAGESLDSAACAGSLSPNHPHNVRHTLGLLFLVRQALRLPCLCHLPCQMVRSAAGRPRNIGGPQRRGLQHRGPRLHSQPFALQEYIKKSVSVTTRAECTHFAFTTVLPGVAGGVR